MMKRFWVGLSTLLLLVALVAPAGIATAQESGSDEQESTADRYTRGADRRDRFYFNIGGVFLRHDTVDELNARDFPLGTIVDWEDVFGLADSTTSFRAAGHIKFHPRHRIRASYFQTKRSSDAELIDAEINWGEITIPVNVQARSQWDTRVLRADYRFSIVQSRQVDVGLALGVYLLGVESRLGINGTPVSATSSQSAPLPLVGLDVEWDLARNFVFKGGFQYLGVKIGDTTKIDGDWAEIHASLEWMPVRHFGIGVGYIYSDVSLDIEFASGVLQSWMINYNTGGLTLYGLASF